MNNMIWAYLDGNSNVCLLNIQTIAESLFPRCSQTTSGLKFLPLLHSKSGSRILAFNIIHSSCSVTLRQWWLAVSFLGFCWPWLTLGLPNKTGKNEKMSNMLLRFYAILHIIFKFSNSLSMSFERVSLCRHYNQK